MFLRSSFLHNTPIFPKNVIIGDSLTRELEVPECRTIVLPGANANFIATIAHMVVGPGTEWVFIIAGTNDLVAYDGQVHKKAQRVEEGWG